MSLCRQEDQADIAIVGAGVSGLATALALHRKGIKCLLLERSPTLRSAGAAIAIYTNGWRALDQLGVGEELRRRALPIQSTRWIALDEAMQKEIPNGKEELRCVKRSDLIATLANHLPCGTIRFGCRLISIESNSDASDHTLQLKGGSLIRTKVLIGCDGVNSVVRNSLHLKPLRTFSTTRTRGYTNYPDGHGFSKEFVRMRRGNFFMGRIPIDDHLVYWFLVRRWLPSDVKTKADPRLIKEATQEAIGGFPAEMIEMVKNSDRDSLHLASLKYVAPWHLFGAFRRGTMTVAGDAMHTISPFLGQGGSAALEDAVVLVRCLAREMRMEVEGRSGDRRLHERIGKAFDAYVKKRRLRVMRLSAQTYLMESMAGTNSGMKRAVFGAILKAVFGGSSSLGHAHYDCGIL